MYKRQIENEAIIMNPIAPLLCTVLKFSKLHVLIKMRETYPFDYFAIDLRDTTIEPFN